jgi:hypothetical protein
MGHAWSTKGFRTGVVATVVGLLDAACSVGATPSPPRPDASMAPESMAPWSMAPTRTSLKGSLRLAEGQITGTGTSLDLPVGSFVPTFEHRLIAPFPTSARCAWSRQGATAT